MWRLQGGQNLRHYLWGAECVVYNNLTGHTHLLDIDALDVLLAMQAGACSLDTLCQALAGGDDPDDLAEPVLQVIEQLHGYSLIEPC